MFLEKKRILQKTVFQLSQKKWAKHLQIELQKDQFASHFQKQNN